MLLAAAAVLQPPVDQRPNILFCIADDWGWPHASIYGEPVVETPAFDRVAREGALFHHAYISSPSCTPSRGAILTGQHFWRLKQNANLWSSLPQEFPVYPEILENAGYHTGHWRKAWGPGKLDVVDRTQNPAGKTYGGFDQFMAARPDGAPFCFWLGASDPHRGYALDSGEKSGMDLSEIRVPTTFPDTPEVRGDIADYFFEVQRFDRDVGAALEKLERMGELENTIVVITGDHGWPFPRGKGNLYDSGSRVPLAVRWPGKIAAGTTRTDFVSLTDLAPTFLLAAGITPRASMTGRSLLDDSSRHIIFGKERHTPAQEAPDMGGTPMRAIRTKEYLYIMNFRPDRWPAGQPDPMKGNILGQWYSDCDNGPTKLQMIANKDESPVSRRLFELSFAKRPAEELYLLGTDPEQLVNVADVPQYKEIKMQLSARLVAELVRTGDERALGNGEAAYEGFPYFGGGGGMKPGFKR
jgi:arylsulfatase A-like enzyme